MLELFLYLLRVSSWKRSDHKNIVGRSIEGDPDALPSSTNPLRQALVVRPSWRTRVILVVHTNAPYYAGTRTAQDGQRVCKDLLEGTKGFRTELLHEGMTFFAIGLDGKEILIEKMILELGIAPSLYGYIEYPLV